MQGEIIATGAELISGRVAGSRRRVWRPGRRLLPRHELTYRGDFSAAKVRVALLKGRAEFEVGRRLGRFAPAALELLGPPSEALFRALP